MKTIINIEKISDFCPSQWEGNLSDGKMFYCRYRWGVFSIDISDEVTDLGYLNSLCNYTQILNIKIGHDFDGELEDLKFEKLMVENGFVFNFDYKEEIEYGW